MILLDGRVVVSATDLAEAATCEFAAMRGLDALLGRLPAAPEVADPLTTSLAELGDAHEQAELDRLVGVHGDDSVIRIGRPMKWTVPALQAAREQTWAAMQRGAQVICQGAFFDGSFLGFADFLVRSPAWSPQRPAYVVHDTKLARHTKVPALLQVGAYADQLTKGGIDPGDHVTLVLGDRTRPEYPLREIVPVYRERRRQLRGLIADRIAADGPISWTDGAVTACGRCDVCAEQVHEHRDLLLVARLRVDHRKALLAAGITTIDELATSTGPVEGLAGRTVSTLRKQARLQVSANPPDAEPGPVLAEVIDPRPLDLLPLPDPGDIFFDFEGDPLYQQGDSTDWGLEYLFGVTEQDGSYRAFWAHDRDQERQALIDFLAYVEQRRRRYPGMHIYHYAPYEKTALLRLAGRYGVGEEEVDNLLREQVLIDLYAVVRKGIRVSQPSYSIKKLEPLYMGDQLRTSEVTAGGDSIVAYHRYRDAVASGRSEVAEHLIGEIADYNAYDCLSTQKLRDWLLAHRSEALPELDLFSLIEEEGRIEEAVVDRALSAREEEERPAVEALAGMIGDVDAAERTPDQQAAALLQAAVGFHRREEKPYWWAHFDRLSADPQDWSADRDHLVIDRVEPAADWVKPPRAKTLTRQLTVSGVVEPGAAVLRLGRIHLLYDQPIPAGMTEGVPGGRAAVTAELTTVEPGEAGAFLLHIDEKTRMGQESFVELPMAVTVGPPIPAEAARKAIRALALQVGAAGELPDHPALDIARRRPPQGPDGPAALPNVHGVDFASAVTEAVRRIANSYVAVQGPPGTGKTYVGAHVIAELVRDGWRIGVTSQGHAAVENLLGGVLAAGVDPAQVAKAKNKTEDPPWTVLADRTRPHSIRDYLDALGEGVGAVVGGTAWDWANVNAVDDGELDLLVIDEAGQFSLANTFAVARASSRLLLLGDPQQLPQVSQGYHPAPVDQSALGWLAAGEHALPPQFGYFLDVSWRMHPAVCQAVSDLAYDGRLRANESVTAGRLLASVAPGVACVEVAHQDNRASSPEEADAIVDLVRSHLGLAWTSDQGEEPRPLEESDIIVVTPYNAQVALVREALDEAGLPDVPVGTVDMFQGQQAAIAIFSTAASSLAQTPRGTDFLLNRNRLNVAISRAKWRAYIVRATGLTDAMPRTPQGLLQLGAFIHLCDGTVEDPAGEDAP